MMIQVKQGYEPLNFTGHFHAWDRDRRSVSGSSVLIFPEQKLLSSIFLIFFQIKSM